jgi:uncharacterized hydrophobic protein (TIGR00271 family)
MTLSPHELTGNLHDEARQRVWRDWLADHIGLDDEQKREVYSSIARSATLRDATYWAEIVFAAGIATMGLVLGSPAVIIGAMLISPLMGPIMAAGLALAAGDLVLTIRAAANVVISCVVAVAFATALVALLPFREMTTEIAARTHPNTLDLVVALFSGAVGALATSKSLRGIATSIPGVAIAVALMPPLCVTGYGLGVLLTVERAQGIAVMRGGALLFLTNLIAITFSSMLVFLALHVDADRVKARIREWRKTDAESTAIGGMLERLLPKEMGRIGSLPARLLILVTLVGVIFIPLKRSFDALSREIAQRHELNAVQRKATELWQERFAANPAGQARSYIDAIEAKKTDGRTAVQMRVFTSRALSREERRAYTDALARAAGTKPDAIDLTLVEIPTSRYEVATRSKVEAPAPVEATLDQQLEVVRNRASVVLAATPMPSGASLIDSAITLRDDGIEATLTYLARSAMSADAQSLVVRDVQTRLGLGNARVELYWIAETVPIAFPSRSTALTTLAHQQLTNLGQRIAEHPDLFVTIVARDDSTRSVMRTATAGAVLRGVGVADERIRTMTAKDQRESDGDVVTVTVTKNQATGVQP